MTGATSSQPGAWAHRYAWYAGWSRVALAVTAAALGYFTLPDPERHLPPFAAYVASALVIQLFIRRGRGGEVRALVGGCFDLAILGYMVHMTGSATTVVVALYAYLGMVMALIHTRRVAFFLAGAGALSYAAIVAGELTGALAYAPAAPPWAPTRPPGAAGVAMAVAIVGVLMPLTTVIVSSLAVAIRRNEAELLAMNERLEALSHRDPLTQLYNRRHLVERVTREIERVKRGATSTLLMVDLDGFKRVNDECGHVRGDELLQRIAGAIQESTRAVDVAGRYGGDEFLALLPDTDVESACAAAERLAAAVRAVGAAFDAARPVTASVGVAAARPDDDPRSWVRRADESTYVAKQRGGDGVATAESASRISGNPGVLGLSHGG
ncbi:MAG: GGDEF domain-containing protein [Polyangiaceae bacterium]|nr:GGDEF domain-containing protein [Polyangiaceae bacterium]